MNDDHTRGHAPGDAPGRPPGEDRLESALRDLRSELEALDGELIRLVGRRRELVLEVGRVKRGLGRPVLDPPREAKVVRRAAQRARDAGVDPELIRDVIWRIIASAREVQTGQTSWGPPEEPGEEDGPRPEPGTARRSPGD